jgi:hypothetical protein
MPALPTLDLTEGLPVSTVAASAAVRHVLEGPPTRAASLGASAGVSWLQVDDYVLALSGPSPTRPPNGVTIAGPSLPSLSGCVVGDGRIETDDVSIAVGRWWDPRPVLQGASQETLADTSRRAERLIGDGWSPLAASMAEGAGAVSDMALSLLGRGIGLTPQGDDLVVGLLAGLRLLGESARARQALVLLDALAPVVVVASSRTTALSATLLGHAWRGEVSAPLGAFLQALTGSGHLEDALAMLGGLGATSGMAMGRGALAAARHLGRSP